MEMIIDTTSRTIKIKGLVLISELMKVLNGMFPDFSYEGWWITEYPENFRWGSGTAPGVTILPYTGDYPIISGTNYKPDDGVTTANSGLVTPNNSVSQ